MSPSKTKTMLMTNSWEKQKMQTEQEKIREVLSHAERIAELGIQRNKINDGVILVCGGNITPQPVAWIWEYWLAQGKLHVLAGAPGQGKTTIALAFCATITSG